MKWPKNIDIEVSEVEMEVLIQCLRHNRWNEVACAVKENLNIGNELIEKALESLEDKINDCW